MVPPGGEMREHKSVADEHTGSIPVHWALGQSSQGWLQEKAEPFEQFDAECKQWERELQDMQRNIEELYNEVKARRKGSESGLDGRTDQSTHNSILHSSVSAECFNHRSNDHSHYQYNDGNSDSLYHHTNGICQSPYCLSTCQKESPLYYANGGTIDLCSHDVNGWKHNDLSNSGCENPVICSSNSFSVPADCIRDDGWGSAVTVNHTGDDGHDCSVSELDEILNYCLGQVFDHPSSADVPQTLHILSSKLQDTKLDCKHEDENSMPLNAALDEIARLSEQFSSYQNEIRKKSGDERSDLLSLAVNDATEEEKNRRNKLSVLKGECCDYSLMPDTLKAQTDPNTGSKTSSFIRPSWHVNSGVPPNMELPVPESICDRKCVSPSVLRKFELMLKENEGKTLTDSGVVTILTPAGDKPRLFCSPGKLNMSALRKSHARAQNKITSKGPSGGTQPVDRENTRETSQGKKCEFIRSVENGCGFEEGPLEHWRPASHSALSNTTNRTMGETGTSWEHSGGCQQYHSSGLHHPGSSLLPVNWNSGSSSCKRGPSSHHKQGMLEGSDLNTAVPIIRPFSRPARPARQRPPSRWAARLPTPSTTTSCTLPQRCGPLSFPYQAETIIM